ncbi:MAG: DegV family protein [Firmicutes bacterium]|jgi:DegV family protein with EDD domain|nr:DegV family protein [Bacillota bacterium]
MKDYLIVTDATCDMNQDILEHYHMPVIPMNVVMTDGRSFLHYPDFRNFSAHEFYQALEGGAFASTSQITPAQYLDFFRPLLADGNDILYICFTSGMSNTYNNAVMAADDLHSEFPDRKFVVIDSLCACGGEGVFAVKAAENREAGMGLEENAAWLTENRLKLAHYFTVGTLTYLYRGGRVNAATCKISNVLDIKPMLFVGNTGAIEMLSVVRGRKASLRKLISLTEQTIRNPEEQTLYISCTDCMDEAKQLRQEVMEKIPCKDVIITTVGPVVGTHTGPSHMCLFSWGTGRRP